MTEVLLDRRTVDVEPIGESKLTSVDKAFAVLDAFRGPGTIRSLLEVAQRTNLPKSTAHRLLQRLCEHGLVIRVGGAYAIGPKMFELGNLAPMCRPRNLRELASPILHELARASGCTTYLGVLHGREVLYLERVPGRGSRGLLVPTGGVQPAHCTSVGKALLAQNPAVAAHALAEDLPRLTPHTITSKQRLTAQLERIRTDGWSQDLEERYPGVRCIGVPVIRPDYPGEAVAAISLSTVAGDLSEHLPSLQRAAARLGYCLST